MPTGQYKSKQCVKIQRPRSNACLILSVKPCNLWPSVAAFVAMISTGIVATKTTDG